MTVRRKAAPEAPEAPMTGAGQAAHPSHRKR